MTDATLARALRAAAAAIRLDPHAGNLYGPLLAAAAAAEVLQMKVERAIARSAESQPCAHVDSDPQSGLYAYRTEGTDRQHPDRRGAVTMTRVGFECAKCGQRVLA